MSGWAQLRLIAQAEVGKIDVCWLLMVDGVKLGVDVGEHLLFLRLLLVLIAAETIRPLQLTNRIAVLPLDDIVQLIIRRVLSFLLYRKVLLG